MTAWVIIGGPIDVAGLPKLFSFYYPGQNLTHGVRRIGAGDAHDRISHRPRWPGVYGRASISARTTSSSVPGTSIRARRPIAAGIRSPSTTPATPYQRPARLELTPLITQYHSEVRVDEYQAHIQDSWKLSADAHAPGRRQEHVPERVAARTDPADPWIVHRLGRAAGRQDRHAQILPAAAWCAVGCVRHRAGVRQRPEEHPPVPDQCRRRPVAVRARQPGRVRSVQGQDVEPETSWTYEAGPALASRAQPWPDHRVRGPDQRVSRRFQQPPARYQPDAGGHCGRQRRGDPPECRRGEDRRRSMSRVRSGSARISRSTTRCRTTIRTTNRTMSAARATVAHCGQEGAGQPRLAQQVHRIGQLRHLRRAAHRRLHRQAVSRPIPTTCR